MERYERETVVTSTDGDSTVEIFTLQKRYLTRLRGNPAFTEVKSGSIEGQEWGLFSIPAADWNPASGAKRRRTLTEEQRQAAAERLKKARK